MKTSPERNSEPQNFEGRLRASSAGAPAAPALARRVCRVTLSLFYKKIEYLPSTFDIHYSIFAF